MLALAAGSDLPAWAPGRTKRCDHVHAVVVAAVAEGVIDDVRLGEAAARAAAVARGVPDCTVATRPSVRSPRGRRCAREWSVVGRTAATTSSRSDRSPASRPATSVGAGGGPAAVDPATTVTVLRERDSVDGALAEAGSWPLVVVTRDRHRHRWQRDQVHRLVAARPDAVVVDMGWPCGERLLGTTLITTSARRASADAVAELLTREDPTVG